MDHQQRSLRFGASVIVCALLLRLTATGFFQPMAEFLAKPNIASFLIYLETGRIVRFSASSEAAEVFAHESAVPDFSLWTVPATEPEIRPVFCAADADGIKFKNSAGLKYDKAELIQQPLQWDLTAPEPTVLILHTHTTESYTKVTGETYKEAAAFRTLDEGHNMVSIGDHLTQLLTSGGVNVIHDRELHDYPSYNGSYNHARKAMEKHLKENPSICLVLDLHRDASGDGTNQLRPVTQIHGKSCAQMMLVLGTNMDSWEQNLSLGLKLQVQLENLAPGITRPLQLRPQRFNQDLSGGALLIEMGAAGNTQAEALLAADYLSEAIISLAKGSKAADSSQR